MGYVFKGTLHSYLCTDCREILAGVQIRLYRHGGEQNVEDRVAAREKDTFRVLSDDDVKAKSGRLIAEATTDEDGQFSFSLTGDEHGYDGEPFVVDVRVAKVPGADRDMDQEPVQFTITSLQPAWDEDGNNLVAAWQYIIPARFWCHILSLFGFWVICGRVVTCKGRQPLPGATVTAFDADWLQDDELGQDTTDFNGYFRIYYTTADFKKTPFSPFINLELTGGPDVYFEVEFGGSKVIDEDQSDGRKPGRQNIGHCFCVELCTDEVVPPDADKIPHWERVEVFEVDTDFSTEGYAGSNSLVMSDGIDLHGNMPLTNVITNQPLKYRFLIGEWGWPGGVEDPTVMPSVAPADSALAPVTSIINSKVGYLYYTDANGDASSAPVIIQSADLDGDGCMQLLGHQVTVDMHDGTTQNIAVSESNFVGAYLLMTMNSTAVTPPPYDVLENLGKPAAGTPVAVADQAPIRRFKLRFQVFDAGDTVDNTTNNKTLDALIIDNTPAKFALHLAELETNLCNPVSNQVHVRYTIDHVHLRNFSVQISNNNGVVHPAPPLPSGAFSGNFFFRGGASGPGGFAVNVAADPACAYAVVLSWQTRHYHSGRGSARNTQILYCK